jgi:hypothetical protein
MKVTKKDLEWLEKPTEITEDEMIQSPNYLVSVSGSIIQHKTRTGKSKQKE